MATINTSITALEEKIGKLKTLKSECEARCVDPNDVVGSGMSIEVIQAVDTEYQTIKIAVQTLLDNSIAFFENVKLSLVRADNNAANKLN